MVRFCKVTNYLVVIASIVLYTSKIILIVQEPIACLTSHSKVTLTIFYIFVVIFYGFLAFVIHDFFRTQEIRIELHKTMRMAYANKDYKKVLDVMEAHPSQFESEPILECEEPLFRSLFELRSKNDNQYQEDNCILCLEEFSQLEGPSMLQLGCKHIFHENCVMEWFKKKFTCPLCKAPQRPFLVTKFFR